MKPQVMVIVLFIVGIGAAIAVSHVKKTQQKSAQQAATVAAGPPAGAMFLEREQDEMAVMATGLRNTHSPSEPAHPGCSDCPQARTRLTSRRQ